MLEGLAFAFLGPLPCLSLQPCRVPELMSSDSVLANLEGLHDIQSLGCLRFFKFSGCFKKCPQDLGRQLSLLVTCLSQEHNFLASVQVPDVATCACSHSEVGRDRRDCWPTSLALGSARGLVSRE